MTPDTRVPFGSVTKAFTAAAVMKYVEEGKIELDAPVHMYVDSQLWAQNGTTLLGLWNNELINDVTVRNCLHMNSGLPDYDEEDNFKRQAYLLDKDESPIEYLWRVDKRFYCAPGQCAAYSSIGWILLGFVLASVQGVEHWWQLDQKSFMNAKQEKRWSEMLFAMRGKCNQYPHLAHQWIKGPVQPDDHEAYFYDLRENSCLNGWTMGNLASSAENVADFFYDLLTGRIVSNSTVEQMMQFEPLTTGDFVGMPYGFGLTQSGERLGDDYMLTGHPGADYASSAKLAGYNAKHDFSFVIVINSEEGMNCSNPAALSHSLKAKDAVAYPILKAVVSLFADVEHSEELDASKPWLHGARTGNRREQRGQTAVIAESSAVRCDYKEDDGLSWYTNGSCLAQTSWGEHYRVTNVTDSAYAITHWYDEKCGGRPAYVERFCPTCSMKDSECMAVSWQDSYPQAQSFTHYPEYAQVYQRIFKAGGVTKGCQWRRLYGHRELSISELGTNQTSLV